MLDQSQSMPVANRPDPVPLILGYLAGGNDVLRTGAVRALAAVAISDDRVRTALLDSLLDEDADVRTDAMDALVHCAQPGDADTLRRSLQGDPVREVKHAAIRALVRLRDEDSIAVLRALACSRAEDDIAWEDDSAAWDDWLDVQVMAIEALGQLGAADCIDDILAARDDEQGQVLDDPVFTALAAMGDAGIERLLTIARNETGLGRKRALQVLAGVQSNRLTGFVEDLLTDPAVDVRRLALPLLDRDDPRAATLVLNDPDDALRRDALCRFAPLRPDLSISALSDKCDLVQAAALDHLTFPLSDGLQSALAENALAWVHLGTEKLAIAAARILPKVMADRACDPLMDLLRDTARPLEARLAAVTALAELSDASGTERLISLLGDEAQQVRAVALTHLARRCRESDAAAASALAMAMDGTLLPPERAVIVHGKDTGPDLAMSKVDDAPRAHLRISPDGEIIEAEPDDAESTGSTLASIQAGQMPDISPDLDPGLASDLASDTPEESPPKRRRRRAIEGPDTIAEDLRTLALAIAGDAPDIAIEAAVCDAATSNDTALRSAAFRALQKRAQGNEITEQAAALITAGLRDADPTIRATAAETLALSPTQRITLGTVLDDPDALVRAIAVRHGASCDQALSALSDPALVVREAALAKVLVQDQPDLSLAVFDRVSEAECIDTLAKACHQSQKVLTHCIQGLAGSEVTPKRVHVLLEALARA